MEEVRPGDIGSAKYKEVIAKLRKDKHLAADVQQMFESNSKIRRNATNIAKEIGPMKMSGGSLNEKRKMQQQQNTIMELRRKSMRAAKGEVECVIINQAGSAKSAVQSHSFSPTDIDNEKWQLQPAMIGNKPFVAICNATILTGTNKMASRLLGMDTYGPVVFMDIDAEDRPVDIELAEFKALLSRAN